MLSPPANFSDFQSSLSAETHMVVKLTDGTSTWYLSDVDMNLTDGHVYPLLLSDPVIDLGIDIYTKRWSVGDVTLSISNAPYRAGKTVPIGGPTEIYNRWVRFSDEIGDLQNQEASIYLICGRRATSLSDGLLKFVGEVIQHPSYDNERLNINIVDKGKLRDRIIPSVKYEKAADDLGYTAGEYLGENTGRKIPLIYGTFTFDIDDPYAGNGMAMGYALQHGRNPDFVFAGHVIDEITDLWSSPIGAFPLEYYDHTLDNDNSGYVTADPARDETTKVYLWLHLKIIGSETYDYEYLTTYALPEAATNPEYLYDDDDNTCAVVKDIWDTGSAGSLIGAAGWSFHEADESGLIAVMNYNDELELNTPYELKFKAWISSSPIISGGTFTVRLLFDEPGLSAGEFYEFHTGGIVDSFGDEKTKSGTMAAISAVDRLCLKLQHRYDSVPSPPADGVANNINVFGAYYVKMKFGICHMPLKGVFTPITNYFRTINWGGPGWIKKSDPTPVYESKSTGGPDESIAWAVCQGREFGSWVDDDGRICLFDDGEYIRDPAYIIESILRDELSLTSSEIDMTSFDVGYNGSVEARLNQIKEESAFGVIRQLTEQSDICFMYDTTSKARLIDLGNSSPSTNRTIPASHILAAGEGGPPDIKISKMPVFCNKMNLSSRWQGEYGIYRDSEVVENSTSQTKYGIYEGEFKWPNICGLSKTHVAGHLVSDADGLWANPHVQIEFETFGYSNADIEVGDWIELDDTTIDPHLKCYGESWSGRQFLVTETKQYRNSTRIKAVELYKEE